MILSVKDLAFKYPGRSVLQDIAFDVAPGECWAVLGINGAGKSTIKMPESHLKTPKRSCVYSRK
jgi:iron complex transport system ATP-binding protein